jgi:6-phosphogluconolactonase
MTQIDNVTVVADAEALARHAATWIAGLVAAREGPFSIALSGGSTPKRLYQILAADYANSLPWSRIHLFFGDERFLPADDKDSNQRMVREALLEHVAIPAGNVHPMPTDGTPEEAAARYQVELQTYYRGEQLSTERPLFDVVLLGLGENGHTASLFPGTPALDDTLHWVVPCVPNDAPHTRLTLTYPAIASSREIAFLLAGEGKREVWGKVRGGDRAQPASRVTSIGRVNWFLDEAAAGQAR